MKMMINIPDSAYTAIKAVRNVDDLNNSQEATLENVLIKAVETGEVIEEGEWIPHQDGRWIYAKCSKCGAIKDTRTKFCPDCGKPMKSGKGWSDDE